MEKIQLEKQVVEYCPVCTLPFEYCEYSKKSCSKEAKPSEEQDQEQKNPEEKKEKKIVNTEKLTITLYEKKNRGLTLLEGLSKQDVRSKDVAKLLSTKFGCGAGSVKKDSLELQGFYRDILKKTLIEEFQDLHLTEDNFIVLDKLKKSSNKKRIINQ